MCCKMSISVSMSLFVVCLLLVLVKSRLDGLLILLAPGNRSWFFKIEGSFVANPFDFSDS